MPQSRQPLQPARQVPVPLADSVIAAGSSTARTSVAWPMILSGLKTLLETGELLTTPGSQRYADPTVWTQ